MQSTTFTYTDSQGYKIFVYKWLPDNGDKIKAIVQISHGMAERASRYERFARSLTEAGYGVYANDHRGHGQTAQTVNNLGYCGRDGFNWMVKDLYELTKFINQENQGLPVFLLGHSMGSFLAQQYIFEYGTNLKGVILSGTSGKKGSILNVGVLLSKLIAIVRGAKKPSPLLDKMSFGSYNTHFRMNRTPFDWLNRDPAEVDKYIDDPFCGFICSAGFFYDLTKGLMKIHRFSNQKRIPKDLPVYLFAGTQDPVGNFTKSIRQLIHRYQELGIKDVTYQFYPEGRHEMLNEINRDQVIQDLIHWLNAHQ